MIKEKIFSLYSDEEYPVQAKAYYLFIFSLVITSICILIAAKELITSDTFTRPGYAIVILTAVSSAVLIMLNKYSLGRNISLTMYTIGIITGIFIGDPRGYQTIALFLLISFFIFFTNKKATLAILIISITTIIVFYYTQGETRHLERAYLIDHLAVIIGFSAMCIIMVSILENHLAEKNVLLKEIHHRVNNNLQIIQSLLELQNESVKDLECKKYLTDFKNRIFSMSMVHHTLYKNENFSAIDFSIVASEIISNLATGKTAHHDIKIHVHVSDIFLTIQQALPCALIINELVSNAREHAFPDTVEDAEIHVSIKKHRQDNRFILEVRDNGRGLPQNFNPKDTETIGFQLITNLTAQLKASLEWHNDNGTVTSISF